MDYIQGSKQDLMIQELHSINETLQKILQEIERFELEDEEQTTPITTENQEDTTEENVFQQEETGPKPRAIRRDT